MIIIKTDNEIKKMRESGKILGSILKETGGFVKEGLSTLDIEIFIRKLIKHYKVKPAFLAYRGYPAVSCISVNEEIVHGIPSKTKILKSGDIVSVDMGVIYKGYVTDAARTFYIGKVREDVKLLVETTKQAFFNGAKMAVEGNHLYDISYEIMQTVEPKGFSLVRDFVSHGVGRQLHEDPGFPNFGEKHTGPKLKYGMTLAIEPMVNMGTYKVKILKDGWTAVTLDGKYSAHYENTVLVGKERSEILTEI